MDPRDSFGRFAVETEDADPTSTLSLYRSALLLRRSLFVGDAFEWLDAGRDDVVAFANGAGVNVTVMRARPYVPLSS
ncbi:MAG TPA: hypothetical protein VIR00_02465 [Micromonosporaceae bacterium]|jgi:alpha-glucosidase